MGRNAASHESEGWKGNIGTIHRGTHDCCDTVMVSSSRTGASRAGSYALPFAIGQIFVVEEPQVNGPVAIGVVFFAAAAF